MASGGLTAVVDEDSTSALKVRNSKKSSTGGTSLLVLECTSHSTCSDFRMRGRSIEVRNVGKSYWSVCFRPAREVLILSHVNQTCWLW